MTKKNLTAVGITCGIGSMLVGARAAGFKVLGNLEWRKYYHVEDDHGRNTFRENFPGAIFKHKIENLELDEIERLMGADLALGHPESHPDIPIYTSCGWIQTSRLKIGDLVLTHRGRFRKVLKIWRRAPGPDTEKITLSRNSRRSGQSIVLAGNHPVLMDDGTWRKAGEIRKGERITYLCERCDRCGDLAPVHLSTGKANCFCYLEGRPANVTAAHEATRRRIATGSHDFIRPDVRAKGQMVQARRSDAEKVVMDALSDVELGWHKLPRKREQDEVKRAYLEDEGWTIVRVQVRRAGSRAGDARISEGVAQVRRLMMNHSGQYEFASFEVNGLWREQFDSDEVLYDLSVDEDNSYVGQSVVLHNCGAYSQLGGVNRNYRDRLNDPGDIPLFVDLVARLRPRFFVMDDLPKSFGAFPMAEYVRRLPDYDLFPEWVSNWGYGNVQKARNRMFMIGSLREERWAFFAEEAERDLTLEKVIGDLPTPRRGSNFPNHDPMAGGEKAQKNLSMSFIGERPTWEEVGRFARENWRQGESMTYHANDGTIKKKPGCKVEYWDGPASVQDGGSYKIHPIRYDSLTLRERARIQGFPDDFVFYGTRLNEAGEYNPDKNIHMCKQTGKAMPVQFCHVVSRQIANHILEDRSPRVESHRILGRNEDIDRAKQWFCENQGYANQERACAACWLFKSCTIRSRKYRIGEPRVGQRDLIDPGVVPTPAPIAAMRSPGRRRRRVVDDRTPEARSTEAVPSVRRLGRRFLDTAISYDLEFKGGERDGRR